MNDQDLSVSGSNSTAVAIRHYKSDSAVFRLTFVLWDLLKWLAFGSPQFVPFRETVAVVHPGQSSQATTVAFGVLSISVLIDDPVR
jgi:hypothetical protein